jgi:hypothetical protein
MGVAAVLADAAGYLLAGVRLAAGDHDFGAEARHQLRRGSADAAAGAGDDGDFAGEIERGGFHGMLPEFFSCDYKDSSYAGLTRVSIFSRAMDCRVKPGNDE